MGFLSNIIKQFKKETKEPEKVSLKVKELDTWLESRLEKNFNSTKDDINKFKEKFKKELDEIKNNLEGLETAKLHNPNIHPKEKTILKGNKQSYIQKINQFIDSFPVSSWREFKDVIEFTKLLEEKLEQLGKNTAKSYYVLQQFHANESRKVAFNIKNIDEHIKKIKETLGVVNLNDIADTKKMILHIKNITKTKEDISSTIKNKNNNIKTRNDTIKKLENNIKLIKEGEEYKQYINSKKELTKLEEDLDKKYQTIINETLPFSKILKKYSRLAIENNSIINDYSDNFREAITKDKDLLIIKILENIKRGVSDDRYDVKNKVRTIVSIDEFIKNVPDYRNEIKEYLEKISQLKKKKVNIIYDIKDKKEEIKKIEEQIYIIKNEVKGLEEKLSKYHIDEDIKKVKEFIKEILDIELNILNN